MTPTPDPIAQPPVRQRRPLMIRADDAFLICLCMVICVAGGYVLGFVAAA